VKLSPREAWIVARLLCGRLPVAPGSIEPIDESERIRPLADRLHDTDPQLRTWIWRGFLTGRPDHEDWTGPVGEADPSGPPPEESPPEAPPRANLSHIRRLIAETAWSWPGWLAGGVLNTLASHPGEGKTILAMNLARILWNGWPWPDGATNTLPAGTKTLWVPGDRHYPQLIELAERYGLPDEAMVFNASADEPAAGYDLDDGATLDALEAAIADVHPGLVIVDTVGMTTRRNLGRPEEARAYFGPLMDIAGKAKVSFLLVTHLSKESQALGRRIVGASRLVWKLTKPDPEGQPDRRKLWVDKTYAEVPKALGMTIGAQGCTFDDKPPMAQAETRNKPSPRLDAVKDWLTERLAAGPILLHKLRTEALAAGYSVAWLYKARESLGIVETESDRKKLWRLADGEDRRPLFSGPPELEPGWEEFEL
jgi:AAA domain